MSKFDNKLNQALAEDNHLYDAYKQLVDSVRKQFSADLSKVASPKDAEALRARYLGRHGAFTTLASRTPFGSLPEEQKRFFGQQLKELKRFIERRLNQWPKLPRSGDKVIDIAISQFNRVLRTALSRNQIDTPIGRIQQAYHTLLKEVRQRFKTALGQAGTPWEIEIVHQQYFGNTGVIAAIRDNTPFQMVGLQSFFDNEFRDLRRSIGERLTNKRNENKNQPVVYFDCPHCHTTHQRHQQQSRKWTQIECRNCRKIFYLRVSDRYPKQTNRLPATQAEVEVVKQPPQSARSETARSKVGGAMEKIQPVDRVAARVTNWPKT